MIAAMVTLNERLRAFMGAPFVGEVRLVVGVCIGDGN